MSKNKLKLAIVGGFGAMCSPMAQHLRPASPAQVVTVHDRGKTSAHHNAARRNWKLHGASFVSSISELFHDPGTDGAIVCCGKNGDDAKIISQIVATKGAKGKFILHLSTVSPRFVRAATNYCREHFIRYANYPLTGGRLGAEKATMLMLACGDEELYTLLSSTLGCFARPRYIGASPFAGAEAKLINHLMVFNGLMGVCSAVALHTECFNAGELGGTTQTDFFDFLNLGAGSTKQWDIVVRKGIIANDWNSGFNIKHALIDALYTADLCLEKKLSLVCAHSAIQVALCFAYVIKEYNADIASQAILREFIANRAEPMNRFIAKYSAHMTDIKQGINNVLASMPVAIRKSAMLSVTGRAFEL